MQEDREKLTRFLNDLRAAFDRVLDRESEVLDPELKARAQSVLPDIHASIDRLIVLLTDPIYDEDLQKEGLTGNQLDLKLLGFNRAFTAPVDRPGWWDRLKDRAGRAIGGVKRAFTSPLGRWAHRVFQWANIILGSLGKVLPGAGATEEFKQVLDAGLDEIDN